MYFICHVTQEDHSVEMSCIFMDERSSLHFHHSETFRNHRHSDN